MMRHAILLATALLFPSVPVRAEDAHSGRYLFRVVEASQQHRDSLQALVKGRPGIPNWVRNMISRPGYVAMASTAETVGGRPIERFMACEAHNCGASQVFVLFSPDGKHVVMRISDGDKGEMYLGDPDEAEKTLLAAP